MGERLAVAVLASGRGSNLRAILDAARGDFPARVVLVVSDRDHALALQHAERAGVRAVCLDPKGFPDRAAFDAALGDLVDAAGARLVCLAGYMRLLGRAFVRRFEGRIMNIHPALLPAFPGLHAQRQALDYGVKIAGATVHFVDEGVDTGPIILQSSVPVLDDDTEEALSNRILVEEHRLYPEAIRLFALARLTIDGRRVRIARAS
ncbi:MAG: phosphoribosylglycinamide formyltransferase [Candidatus Rokubacteria bacterium]|nr:phosphoribosylglycinamide formyltransferase [Candidatus Rokubacteria bacterium]